ncbi:glutamate--tRNA ligase [Conexibacter sp. DBS9H8]|uniref:glutamate--tRNA ligase n=1 Tax=Conexibacter sp. DBS9H8 TaxID=2937801 RepID=UPI00200DE993|nr:glutamate--tRNA ligase [Conexibacter sp. DBS9H8]
MRVRFAPSPTGQMHIGNARTAIYNWLLARGPERATFVLRVEDTDPERSSEANVAFLLDALAWLGLDWDEGPIRQTDNTARHQAALATLLVDGRAYRSRAGAAEVAAYRATHGAERGFRGEDDGEGAVRLRVPDTGATTFTDVIRGEIATPNVSMDDPVIARADGSVLYNFAVAVDDIDAQITHVLRGEDHISNTPRQLLVMEALGATPPVYAHLPLIRDESGKKLSKRHGAASVQQLRDLGYLPEAVVNYLSLLGAGFAADEEFFTPQELAQRFRLAAVSKSPAVFDERKLRHLNGQHLRALPVEELTRRLQAFTGADVDLGPAVAICREKIQTLADFWPLAGFLYDGPADDPAAAAKWLGSEEQIATLRAARDRLAQVPTWDVASLEAALSDLLDELGLKPGQLYQPIRVALAGRTVSPGIFETLAVLGPEASLARIDRSLTTRG